MNLSYLLQFLTVINSFYAIESRNFSNYHPLPIDIKSFKIRIIGGDEVIPNSVPHQVGLLINANAFCGGSLISKNYVLTAGHCGSVIRTVEVILGAHNITNSNEITQMVISGKKVIVHEKYDESTLYNDIALIELIESVTLNSNIAVISLPSRSDVDKSYVGEISTATGWGIVTDLPRPTTNDLSDVLKSVDVGVIDIKTCAEYYNDIDSDVEYINSNNICTSGYRNKGTCNGDSGGPLISNGTLIGLTSFGTDLCELCAPSVYTKVASYLDWIGENSDVNIVN